MIKKNQQIENKNITAKTNFFTQVWKNLCEYPKSIIFYFLMICLGLFTSMSKFIFGFNFNHYIIISLFTSFTLLFLAFYLGEKKFFVSIANLILIILIISYFMLAIIHNNSWDTVFIAILLIKYSFYLPLFFVFFISMKKQTAKMSIQNNYLNQVYFIIPIIITLSIPYLILFKIQL